jgi:hypothetical protein
MEYKNKPKAGSYEAFLTEEERFALHSLLLSGDSLPGVREKTIPWRDGPDKGMKPSVPTLCKIKTRLRTEKMVRSLDEMLETMRATKTRLAALVRDSNQEELLDAAMAAIGREVLEKTLEGQIPAEQRITTRLLLKRADQHRFDRRMTFLEAEFEKNKKVQPAPPGKEENGQV